MNYLPLFPKPGQVKKPPVAVKVFKGGREKCNLLTKDGRHEYQHRKRTMWERQNRICCLYRWIKECPGKLNWDDTTFDHEIPRGHGGGSQDDRIFVEDKKTGKMKWQNGAAHYRCNIAKGSRRIPYNDPK